MMKTMLCGVLLAALYLPFPVNAMTAVCKDPKGRLIGLVGGEGVPKRIDEPDGMTGGVFTFVWEPGAKVATVTAMGTPPSEPETRRAHIVFETAAQVTFLDPMTSAVWMYSVYPRAKRMILTSHNDGAIGLTGGAIAKVFDGECSIGE